MNAYEVFARKYRPKNFQDLLGQDVLITTLRNAIRLGKIAHAFMLTGIRGIGKTTTARVLARALNYETDDVKEPSFTMPTYGLHCEAILKGEHPDVIELDAASHTGVDDMREIIQQIVYKPILARYKIYIIDEVHMLSKAAFNALLKTIEEPPPYVIFIFATTDLDKVPLTVLSRCQHFALRPLTLEHMMTLYHKVIAEENINAEEEALKLLASMSGGSAREALSLLDRVLLAPSSNSIDILDVDVDGTTQETLTLAQAQSALYLDHFSNAADILEAVIIHGDVPKALTILKDAYHAGVDPIDIARNMLSMIHSIIKMFYIPTYTMEDDSWLLCPNIKERITTCKQCITVGVASVLWQIINRNMQSLRHTVDLYKHVQIMLIEMVYARAITVDNFVYPRDDGDHGQDIQTNNNTLSSKGETKPFIALNTIDDIILQCEREKMQSLAYALKVDVKVITCHQGFFVFEENKRLHSGFIKELKHYLEKWTGVIWDIYAKGGEDNLSLSDKIKQNPLVQTISNHFLPHNITHQFDILPTEPPSTNKQ